jgi:hypothetical protein
MVKLRLFVIFLMSVVCWIEPALSDVVFEPYAGYEKGKMKFMSVAGLSGSEWDASGFALGARLSFAVPMLFFALDYSTEVGSGKRTSPSSLDSDLSGSSLFLLMGMDVPKIRGWLGYGLMQETTFKSVPGMGNMVATGSGLKLGLSYTGLSFLDLNFEYIRKSFLAMKMGASEVNVDGTADIFRLSVSFPIKVLTTSFEGSSDGGEGGGEGGEGG